ncbi:MAG TPA: hypothetical protein VN428_21060 [Bryobacteraceae bacterium]|nr:hypothetical protein [Bryobacteraceae bacterium]
MLFLQYDPKLQAFFVNKVWRLKDGSAVDEGERDTMFTGWDEYRFLSEVRQRAARALQDRSSNPQARGDNTWGDRK